MKSLRNILTIAALCVAVQAGAQKISGGIEAGLTTGPVKISQVPNSLVNSIKGNNIMGYEAGFYMKLGLGPFYVRPEVLLNHRSGQVDVESEINSTQSVDFKMSRLEIPLMFGLELLGPVNIEAGPVYNKVLDVTESFNNQEVSINESGLGYRLGGIVQLGPVGFGVHYQGLKIGSSGSRSDFALPNELIFSLGFQLGSM